MKYASEYDAQAGEFLRKHGVTIRRRFLGCMPYFDGDKESRNVWRITFRRGDRQVSFRFGDSLVNTWKTPRPQPDAYALLSCAASDSSFDCADVWAMIDEYGYDPPRTKAEYTRLYRSWKAAAKLGSQLRELFSDCLDDLQEVS